MADEDCHGTITASSDVLAEVLIRLPVKSILRFRAVCRSWNSLITSDHFVELHLEHARRLYKPTCVVHPVLTHMNRPEKDVKLCFIESPWPFVTTAQQPKQDIEAPTTCHRHPPCIRRTLSLPLDFPRRATLHTQPCRGLWLLHSDTEYSYYEIPNEEWSTSHQIVIVNPATRKWVRLPPTRQVSRFLLGSPGFGYVSRTKEYKVISITMRCAIYGFEPAEFGAEVLTLDRGGGAIRWRSADPPNPEKFDVWKVRGQPVLLHEAVHWVFLPTRLEVASILCFQLETEKFHVIPAPPETISPYTIENPRHTELLLEFHGRLGLILYESPKLELWTLEDYTMGVWSKQSFDISESDLKLYYPFYKSTSISSPNDQGIFISSVKCVYSLNERDGAWIPEVVHLPGEGFRLCIDDSDDPSSDDDRRSHSRHHDLLDLWPIHGRGYDPCSNGFVDEHLQWSFYEESLVSISGFSDMTELIVSVRETLASVPCRGGAGGVLETNKEAKAEEMEESDEYMDFSLFD